MSEFLPDKDGNAASLDSMPVPPTPTNAPPSQTKSKKESLLTRPLFLGQSLPWLVGGVLVIGFAAWYLFWPAGGATPTELSARAFEGASGFSAVESDATATAAPAPLQTGGLNVPVPAATSPHTGSVPDEVVQRIVDGEAFGAANREAITRLSDTVRAQSVALAALQKHIEALTADNKQLFNRVTVLESRQPAASTGQGARANRVKSTARTALSGMRLESVQDGMAWVSWQGRTWALQPGDSLGTITVREVNVAERSVTTSVGVLR